MLTECFVAATLAANKPVQHASTALKDVGIFLHELQPQSALRHGYKKSSVQIRCLAVTESHIFAAQADKAVINVYSREKGNQEATVPFPDRIHSLAYARGAAIIVLGTEGGSLILWEIATGRLSTSAASHLQSVDNLCIAGNNDYILSGSPDSSVHIWSLPKLVAFRNEANVYNNDAPTNVPRETFSHHRDAITALACGHSKYSTNFAVSASHDQTVYLWHIETAQILRTFLLPTRPFSLTVDPADRAVFVGDDEGGIAQIAILSSSISDKRSIVSSPAGVPVQIDTKELWTPPSAQVGATLCLTLSYDATALISGHTNGSIIRWNIAKRRVANEIINFGQPVTNIEMLKPDGFHVNDTTMFSITDIVKPKLEFNTRSDNGTCGIPSIYSFQATLTGRAADLQGSPDDEFYQALHGPGFPQSMLDAAVRAMAIGSAASSTGFAHGNETDIAKAEKLEDQVTFLKHQLASMQHAEMKMKERKLARMEKREELGLQKRQAYFDAKKKGKDGEAAMKAYEEKEALIDEESDDEALGGEMDIG